MALVLTLAGRIASKTTRPFRNALGAVACDLLRNARFDEDRWSYRPMGSNSFTGTRGSHRTVPDIMEALSKLGLIDHVQGYGAIEGGNFGARASRFRAKPALIALAADHGITPGRWRDHFEVPPAENVVVEAPLVLRGSKRRMGSLTLDAPNLPIEPTDALAQALRERMEAINAFIGQQHIDPWGQIAFRRAFLLGDREDFAWDKGGRIAAAGGSYQHARPAERKTMTINGEGVTEIDIRASNLTILHGLRGVLLEKEDPYEVEGIDREIVKDWVTMTLGHSGFHTRWPDKLKAKWAPIVGDLPTVHPISQTRQQIVKALPILADWPSSPISWADLQYTESNVILRTMETLAFGHDVPCLPVHDSIIVPTSKAALASSVLEECFHDEVDIIPRLKAS